LLGPAGLPCPILHQRNTMTAAFATYDVEKTDEPFVLPSGEEVSQTAKVSFRKENGDILFSISLGVVEPETLYEQVSKGEPVQLEKCYIENFSLKSFREAKELKPHQWIAINGFVVTHSVFDLEEDIDFSNARFASGNLDLSHSYFLGGSIHFDRSDFGDAEARFDNACFYEGGVRFPQTHFGKGLLSFINSRFYHGGALSTSQRPRKQGRRKRNRNILDFEGASFGDGKIDFTRSQLGSGDITFSNTTLKKRNILFIKADFVKVRLTFKSMHCQDGKIDFRFADFQHGDLLFDRAVLQNGMIDFSATEFELGKISFNRTEFDKYELNFESSELEKGTVQFKNNIFGAGSIDFDSARYPASNISFENVDFGKFTASFTKAVVKDLSFKTCHLNAYFNLHLKKCRTLDLSNTVVRDIVDLKPYDFTPDIQLLNLSGLLLLGHFYIDWKTNQVKELILNQDTSHRNKSEQFRILKENYHSLGQYDAEDEAYVEFRRAEAKANLETAMTQGNLLTKINAAIVHAFRWLVFDKIGLYATSPVRVLKSMFFSYLFFVFLFYFLPYFIEGGIQPSIEHTDNLTELEIAFYHSIITFLTIGYGDYYPSGVFRWISGFEGFMGLFLISYFTVAFVRKVLR
jgi:hypothetical protein